MAVRRLDPIQPADFAFTAENLDWATVTIAKYPAGRQASAVIPLLWRAQEQHDDWLPEPAIRYVAELLDMPRIRVYEVATFYTMFQLSPVGRNAHIQVCGTTPCMLRGSEELMNVCRRRIAAEQHQVSEDGKLSWEEMECLGACVNAPLIQVGKDLYEDLTPETFETILDQFANGETPKPGPQIDRAFSAPIGGATTLQDVEALIAERQAAKSQAKATPTDADSAAGLQVVGGADAKAEAPTPSADAGRAERPAGLHGARDGTPDNLKQISGVGAALEEKLNALGIFHFDQIAAWTSEQVRWVDDHLSFKGRIAREDWIAQAATLAAGGATEFSKRVEKGEVEPGKDDDA